MAKRRATYAEWLRGGRRATYAELCEDIVQLRRLVKWCIEHAPSVSDLGDGEWMVTGDGCGCCADTVEVPAELRAVFFDIVREVPSAVYPRKTGGKRG